MTKHKKDGLISKVMKVPHGLIVKEDHTKYIPWCDHFPHYGIIKDENVCKQRHCKHYKKLYI